MRYEISPRFLGYQHGRFLHSPVLVVKERPSDGDVHLIVISSDPKIFFENFRSTLLTIRVSDRADNLNDDICLD